MLSKADIENTLFIDIETAPGQASYQDCSSITRKWWDNRAKRLYPDLPPEEAYIEHAGLTAEFGRIVCISCGVLVVNNADHTWNARIRSFYGQDELQILSDFTEALNAWQRTVSDKRFCGHNIKDFDLPYISRRLMAHRRQELPKLLQVLGKKPWEITHFDTMEAWAFGEFKYKASLELILDTLGLPSPKSDFDGAMVGKAFWNSEFDPIARYCERDVAAVMRLALYLSNQGWLEDENIRYSVA